MSELFRRASLIFSIIFLSQVLIVNGQRTSTDERQTGKVYLTSLRSINDLPLFGITVFIEGNNLRKEISLIDNADEPSALVDLPIGIYRVTTKRTFDNYRFIRSAFRVQSGTVTRINVLPPFRVLEQMLVIDGNGVRDEYIYGKEPKYRIYGIPNDKSGNIELIIRYEREKQTGRIITFRGDSLMASYDAFSIYANEMRINLKTLEFEAFGNVVLENGLKREKAKSAKAFFENGEIKFQVDTNPL